MGRLGPQAKEGVVPAPAGLPASALLGLRSPGRGQAYRVIPNGNYDPLPARQEVGCPRARSCSLYPENSELEL